MDLASRFKQLGVPHSVFSIGADENERYCLVEESDGWHVYYSERGRRNNERVFAEESEAAAELWRVVTNDGAVKELLRNKS
ncbi:MAG TPA: hypothetical protein VIP82_02835 [Microbacterium sp.]|uniref:hypothetical protein n=1 Tax=Microbacterium sp. TaxID=51671 RepID=UPI002F937936